MKIIIPFLVAAFLAACASAPPSAPSGLGTALPPTGMPEPGNHWPNPHGP